ncbi:assimilatory nitrate reductase NasA [Halocatena halophila]|uniref:assimilatory nitrate reductase NasA n=1 Tax=Halocatena halophila TaxID=2814576 RepID=UPI002ED1193E
MNEFVRTTCMRCAVGCGHVQRPAEDGHDTLSVRGDTDHPVSEGLACSRGLRESRPPERPELTQPLVRRDGTLCPTTWAEALDHVIRTFEAIQEHNRDGIAVLASGQQTNEAAYALGKLARGGLGTRYYDANTTLCMSSAVAAYDGAFGSDGPPCTYDDIPAAQTHLVWGANPAVAHPVLFRWIHQSVQQSDSKLVVVDPVVTKTAEQAAVHCRPDPGCDLALARAVLARAIERNVIDREFIASATIGFGAARDSLSPPNRVAATAGVSIAEVDDLVDAFADPTLVYWGMGVNQSTQGTATARALIDCCLATGNVGPASGPFSLTGQANSMGARVCSSKGSWPGYREFTDADERRTVADTWAIPVERLPDDPGPGPVGIVESIAAGPIEALWTVGTNPVAGLPDTTAVRERLDATFLVVQDAFRSETAELADVVFPTATWGESSGTAMNMDRTVSRVRPASVPPAGHRSDLEIITTLGNRIVPGLFDVSDPRRIFDEFAGLTADTTADCSGITYERLERELAVRWPAPDEQTAGGYRYYNRDADSDTWCFPTSTGRASFSTGCHDGVPEPTDESYPLTLTTARRHDRYNTGVRTRVNADRTTHPVARINPATFTANGRKAPTENERPLITIESRRASITARVEPDEAIPKAMVWLPIHHPVTNHLTIAATDPDSNEPNYKQCAVRLIR